MTMVPKIHVYEKTLITSTSRFAFHMLTDLRMSGQPISTNKNISERLETNRQNSSHHFQPFTLVHDYKCKTWGPNATP